MDKYRVMLGLGNTLVGGAPSPEFTPASLSGLVIWLRYNTGLEESDESTPEDGEQVTKWADASGEGNHGTKSGSGFSNYDATLKSPYFDGSSDSLEFSQFTFDGEFSVYARVMLEATGETINADILLQDKDIGNNFWRINSGTVTRVKLGGGGALNFTHHSSIDLSEDVFYNFGLERDGSNNVTSYLGVDGSDIAANGASQSESKTWLMDVLGKGLNGGYVAEVVVTTNVLTAAERQSLHEWLTAGNEG